MGQVLHRGATALPKARVPGEPIAFFESTGSLRRSTGPCLRFSDAGIFHLLNGPALL
jgi:hypothetical protein